MSNAIYDKFKSDYKGTPFDSNQDEYTFGEQYERRLEFKRRTGVAINELEGEINKRQFISYTSLAQLTLLDSDLTLGDESLSLELIRSRMINLSYLIVEVEQGTNLNSVCNNKVGLLLIERYNDNLTTLEFISSDNLNTYKGVLINSIWSNWEEEINRTKLDSEILTINNSIDTKLDKTATSINSLALGGKTRAEFDTEIEANASNIQSRYELPHPSLEYALFVENGELKEWSKDGKSKLQTSNQVGNGDSDTHSLNDKGLNGVIAQDDLYIGEGYENVANVNALKTGPGYTFSESNNRFTITSTNEITSLRYFMPFQGNWKPNTNYLIKWKVIEGEEYFSRVFFNNKSFYTNEGYALALTGDYPRSEFSYVYAKEIIPNGEKLVIDVMLVEGAVIELPYIKDSIQDGRCVLDVPWTSADHSFIYMGATYRNDGTGYFHTCLGSNERIVADVERVSVLDFVKGTYDIVGNSNIGFFGVNRNDQSEKRAGVSSVGINPYNLLSLGVSIDDRVYSSIEGVFSFFDLDTRMTKEELQKELLKFKSGKIKLDPMGFVENIPNSKKRMDKYGNLKTHIEVGDISTDLWLSDDEALYEIIDYDTNLYTCRVKSDGTIVGNGLEDVSGMLRVTSDVVLPCQIRKVM